MNALQIIPTKPLISARRATFRLRGSDALLLLALIGGMSMSRGEEGTASEPVAAVASRDNGNKVADNDKTPSATQPAAASVAATTEAPSAVTTDQKAGSEVGAGAAAEAKPDAAVRAGAEDRHVPDRDSSRVLAKLSTAAPASTASKSDLVPKPEDAKSGRRHAIRRLFARQGWLGGPANQEVT